MADTRIELIFEAIDRATNTINKVNNGLKGVASQSSIMSTAIGTAIGGLATTGITAALGAITQGTGAIINELGRASDVIQQRAISASGMAQLLELPYEETKQKVKELNTFITENFKGNTQPIKDLGSQIFDTFALASKEVNGAFNFDEINQKTATTAQNLLLMGLNAEEANDLLSGLKSTEELLELEGFRDNAKLLERLKSQAQERFQVKDITDLKASQITGLVEEIFKVDEAAKREIEKGLQTQISSFQKLFSLDFSVNLDQLNGKTVVDAATDIMTSFNNLFTTIGNSLGFTKEEALVGIFNAMTMIAGGIDNLTRFFVSMSEMLGGLFEDGVSLGDHFDISVFFFDLGVKIGDVFYGWMDSVDWWELILGVGNVILAIISGLTGLIAGFATTSVEWIGGIISNLITSTANLVVNYVTTSLSSLYNMAAQGVTNFVSAVQSALTSFWNTIKDSLIGAFTTLAEAVANPIGEIASGVASATGFKLASLPASSTNYSNSYSTSNAPTFNANITYSGDNYNAMADQVIAALDSKWKVYRESFS